MPRGASVVGGLNAGTRLGELKQQQRRDEFDQQQVKLSNYQSIVGSAEESLAALNEQMAIKRAAAPSSKDQHLIDQKYLETYQNMINQLSRTGERAMKAGVPVDVPAQLAPLTLYRELADLNAEAVVEAQAAGAKAGATARGQADVKRETPDPINLISPQGKFIMFDQNQPNAQELMSDLTQAGYSIAPSRQRQNVSTTERTVPTPTTGEKPDGIGTQLMEDITQSTGIEAGISKGFSHLFGQFFEGTNPRLDAAQRIKNTNQEIKFAFSRNPKFPVAEMKAIEKDLLISPDAWLVDPEAEAKKVIILKESLETWNEADRVALPRLTDDKAQDALERMGTRQTVIDLIGEVPSLEESDSAELDTLDSKIADGSATDEEVERYLELTK